jgi:hypothetical protein
MPDADRRDAGCRQTTSINFEPPGIDGHSVHAADWLSMGISSQRNGVRVGHDLLTSIARLAGDGQTETLKYYHEPVYHFEKLE